MQKSWNNLLRGKCPLCGGKLHFRRAGRDIKFHQRSGANYSDIYLCRNGKCSFQITSQKMLLIVMKVNYPSKKEKIEWNSLK